MIIEASLVVLPPEASLYTSENELSGIRQGVSNLFAHDYVFSHLFPSRLLSQRIEGILRRRKIKPQSQSQF
eukprot:Gb_19993 [translate_table: standard]